MKFHKKLPAHHQVKQSSQLNSWKKFFIVRLLLCHRLHEKKMLRQCGHPEKFVDFYFSIIFLCVSFIDTETDSLASVVNWNCLSLFSVGIILCYFIYFFVRYMERWYNMWTRNYVLWDFSLIFVIWWWISADIEFF